MSDIYPLGNDLRLGSCILVCSEFGADNAGSHRQERWAKEFLALSADVFVLFPVSSLKIAERRFSSISDLEEFRQDVRRTLAPGKTSRAGVVARIFRFLKYYFLLEFFLPINFILAVKLVFRLVSTRNVAAVHISSPPFPFAFYCTIIAALIRPKVKIHIDMRDPWATHRTLGGIKFLKLLIEKTNMRLAHTVTSATGFMAEEFRDRYGIESKPVYNVATHIPVPEKNISECVERDTISNNAQPIRIVFAGTMPEGFYDIALLADWLAALYRDNKYFQQCEWFFVGECGLLELEIKSRLDTSAWIRFSHRVSHEKAVEIMSNAGVLLFLGHRFPGYLTTKLFEYISLRKPILPLFLDIGSEPYNLIKQICGECPSIKTYENFKNALVDFHKLPHLRNEIALEEMRSAYGRVVRDMLRVSSEAESDGIQYV